MSLGRRLVSSFPQMNRGRTTIVVETDVRDAEGRHVARVTQTQAVLGA